MGSTIAILKVGTKALVAFIHQLPNYPPAVFNGSLQAVQVLRRVVNIMSSTMLFELASKATSRIYRADQSSNAADGSYYLACCRHQMQIVSQSNKIKKRECD